MTNHDGEKFRVGLVTAACLFFVGGCASSGKTNGAPAVTASGSANTAVEGVNPERAHRPLDQIEPPPSPPQRPESLKPLSERASRQIDRAERLVDEQRYTEAAIELERALRYDPDHPDIHRTLAMLHWQAGNIERAKRHVEQALDGNLDDATTQYVRGRCAAFDGDHPAAVYALRTAMECSDFDADSRLAALTHYYLAESLAAEGYITAALSEYDAFARVAGAVSGAADDPRLAALLGVGETAVGRRKASLLEKLGRYGAAADALAPAVAASADVELKRRYARLLLKADRLEEALSAARAIPAGDEETLDLLYAIHEAAGHPERIVEDLRARLAEQPSDARLILNLANALVRLGQTEAARQEVEKFLSAHPKDEVVRARLAALLIEQEAWEAALRTCAEGLTFAGAEPGMFEEKILNLSGREDAVAALLAAPPADESAAASYLRGVLAAAVGRVREAETFLRRSLEARADFVPARVALAQLYIDRYRYDDALAVAGRGDSDTPEDPRLELILGRVYDRLDDIDRAEMHYRAATQQDRSDPRPLLALARLYERTRRTLQAQRQLRVLLDQHPQHAEARELLAKTYLSDGKFDVAMEQYERLARSAESALTRARAEALVAQARQADVDAYRTALREAMAEHGEDAGTWLALADSYDLENEPSKRAEAFERALALEPDNERAASGLVDTYQRMLRFEDAAPLLERLLRRRPNRHPWRLALIDLYATVQDYDNALALAHTALGREDLDTSDRQLYRVAVLRTQRMAGREADALAMLKDLHEAEPDEDRWTAVLAEQYVRMDRPAEAIPLLEALYRANPDFNALLPLVQTLQLAKEYDRAAQFVLGWLRDDPENDNALIRLAMILLDQERFDAALELVESRLPHTLRRERFQNLKIEILRQAGRFSDALDMIDVLIDEVIALLRKAHEGRERIVRIPVGEGPAVRLPDEPFTMQGLQRRLLELRNTLSVVLILSEQYRAAAQELQEWLEDTRDPDERFEYLRRLSLCYQGLGEPGEATEYLERALVLKPRDVGLNNDVAYGWIDRGIRLDEAEEMIEYALWRQPRNAAFLDTYGWLLYKRGDLAGARKWLGRARRLLGTPDPVVLDHLGDTYWRLGDAEQAIAHWTEALELARQPREDRLPNPDEERVKATVQQKIDDARAGKSPAVAPLASADTDDGPSEEEDGADDNDG